MKEELIEGLKQGDRKSLAKAISLAESTLPEKYNMALEIIEHFGPQKDSFRLGITGTPGAGKSTFINSLGSQLLSKGLSTGLAVLTIDPSSSISGGSILGDKTRMTELSRSEQVFIRPTASGAHAGGLSRNTRLAILLCEAAGFKDIIVETVGVGQGETELSQLTDLFLLLLNPGGGDELQGIKRGIVEMADLLVVNKADGGSRDIALQTARDYSMAQQLMPETESRWKPRVLSCSALEQTGFEEIIGAIKEFRTFVSDSGYKTLKRSQQMRFWVQKTLQAQLMHKGQDYQQKIEDMLEAGGLPERVALKISNEILRH